MPYDAQAEVDRFCLKNGQFGKTLLAVLTTHDPLHAIYSDSDDQSDEYLNEAQTILLETKKKMVGVIAKALFEANRRSGMATKPTKEEVLHWQKIATPIVQDFFNKLKTGF